MNILVFLLPIIYATTVQEQESINKYIKLTENYVESVVVGLFGSFNLAITECNFFCNRELDAYNFDVLIKSCTEYLEVKKRECEQKLNEYCETLETVYINHNHEIYEKLGKIVILFNEGILRLYRSHVYVRQQNLTDSDEICNFNAFCVMYQLDIDGIKAMIGSKVEATKQEFINKIFINKEQKLAAIMQKKEDCFK